MLCWIRAVHHKPSAQPRAESSSPTPKPRASGSRLPFPRHSPHAWHSQRGRDVSCSLAHVQWRTHSAARPRQDPTRPSAPAFILAQNRPGRAPQVKVLSRELQGTAAWCTPEECTTLFLSQDYLKLCFSVNVTTNWEF